MRNVVLVAVYGNDNVETFLSLSGATGYTPLFRETLSMAKKILIVEDEKLIGLMLAENVKDLGCHVTKVVTNGKAALSSVHDDPPDAILMDISLDGVMDGIETARQIKAWRDIPILFFTGYQDPHLLSQADAVKPVGIVDKLDTTENIQQAIVSLLQ